MNLEQRMRLIAGTFILLTLALAHWVSPYWLLFTAFVGANLIQSSITKWCLMEDILKKYGLAGEKPGCCGEGR
ncbi:DUF2892 domain-containing protein [Elusimicrobiota bacterium]